MAWEIRDKNRYLYTSYRDADGRIRHKYLGRGSGALKADANRKSKAKAREDRASLQKEAAEHNRRAETLDQAIADLMKAELLSHGYHQHSGTWRKKHDQH